MSKPQLARNLIVIPSGSDNARHHRRRFRPCDLGPASDREVTAIEFALSARMSNVLAQLFGERVPAACVERKMLPAPMLLDLEIVFLVSHTSAAAKAAHRLTGVPAAILIADALCLDAMRKPLRAFAAAPQLLDFFSTGRKFPTVGASFLHHAGGLVRDRRFRPVLLAAQRGCHYVEQMKLCERWTENGRTQRIALIVGYGLHGLDESPKRAAS